MENEVLLVQTLVMNNIVDNDTGTNFIRQQNWIALFLCAHRFPSDANQYASTS